MIRDASAWPTDSVSASTPCSRKVTIAYVVESLEVSGGVKVIIEHAEGLASRGHEVSIVTRDSRHPWIPIRVPVNREEHNTRMR